MGDAWWWIMEIVSGIIIVGVVFKYNKEYTKKHNPLLGVCTGCWHEEVLLYEWEGKMLCAECVEILLMGDEKTMTKIDLGVKYQLEKYYSLEEGIDEVCPELKKDGIIRAYYDKVRWNKHQLQKRVDELVDWDGGEEV